MNTRLQAQYQSIEEQNQKKFLDNEIELDTHWGTSVWGTALQINLSDKVKDQIEKYQKDLGGLEPGKLLFPPRDIQHISVNPVVFWGGEYPLGTEGAWNSISEEFLRKLEELDQTYPSFNVTFSKLIATPAGIIWVALDENEELENIRNEFLSKLPFPKGTTRLNHIIHTTVVRFKGKLNNPQTVLDYIEDHNEQVEMKVERIILKNELVFPTLKTKTLAEVRLK